MEFGVVSKAVGAKANEVVDFILKQNWPQETKRKFLRRLFALTGDSYYNRIFEMSSDLFASTAIKDLGFTNPDGQIERLSTTLVRNYNLTRKTDAVTTEFYYAVMSDAQFVAFRNAQSLDLHPTITRVTHGKTCEWCQRLAGAHIEPGYEVFRHHERCDCSFILSGYGSRDGEYIGHAPNRYENPRAWLKENRMKGVQ